MLTSTISYKELLAYATACAAVRVADNNNNTEIFATVVHIAANRALKDSLDAFAQLSDIFSEDDNA